MCLKVILGLLFSFNNHQISSNSAFISQSSISIKKVLFQLVTVSTTVYLAVNMLPMKLVYQHLASRCFAIWLMQISSPERTENPTYRCKECVFFCVGLWHDSMHSHAPCMYNMSLLYPEEDILDSWRPHGHTNA